MTGNLSKDNNTSLKLNCLNKHPRLKQTKLSGKRRIVLTKLSEGQTEYQATNRRAGNEYWVINKLRTRNEQANQDITQFK